MSEARTNDQRVSTEVVSTLLSGIESLMLVSSTKAFLNSPLDIPKIEEMVAILAGEILLRYVVFLKLY